ncbi:hypothetical protein D9M68_744270 [compost metagenome]
MQGFGGRPALVACVAVGQGLATTRPAQASDLMRRIARVIGNIRRVVVGQPKRADFFCDTQAAVVLHGARSGCIGLGEGRWRGVLFEENAWHPPAPQLQSQDKAGWAAANNQYP